MNSVSRQNRTFFITGTDTDIGKTYISKLLADTFAESAAVTYMKPIQTGCSQNPDGSLVSPDGEYVFSGKVMPIIDQSFHIPYKFQPACSPHLAAQLSQSTIRIPHILSCFRTITQKHDGIVLVEGAGGLFVPLNNENYIIDLIKALDIPVIVVSGNYLGMINHTVLTLHALQTYGIPLQAVIINSVKPDTPIEIHDNNIQFITDFCKPVPVFHVAYHASVSDESRRICHELSKYYSE